MTRRGLSTVNNSVGTRGGNNANRGAVQTDRGGRPSERLSDDYRIENHNVMRVPPRDRGPMEYHNVGRFWGGQPHYFGWRVHSLPPRHRVVRYMGLDYYFWDDVFYRNWGGYYTICRPPIGVILSRTIRDVVFSSVLFAYYPSVYRPYGSWYSYYDYIDAQNRTIAQNNAIIAQQNAQIAMNSSAAQSSYNLAGTLGLTQSYANANQEYYYEDGVFYILNANGRYEVIVPPAGALVENLPEDFEIITLNGIDYYRVDDTVYTVTQVGGHPYFEVLGQMNSNLIRKYNIYG